MSALRSLSRTTAQVGISSRPCVRSLTSSAPHRDAPKSTYDALFQNLERSPATANVTRQRPAQRSRPAPTTTADASPNPQGSSSSLPAYNAFQRIVRDSQKAKPQDVARAEAAKETVEYERQMTRRWREGDVYSPHDLSGVEMSKWKTGQRKGRPKTDVFDMLKINPLNHYWNFSMMSEFMTEMGRIKHSNETGLRPVNQRKVARAVRRAIGLGLMPSVHKHPEILNSMRPRS